MFKRIKKLSKGLFVGFAALFCVLIPLYDVAAANSSMISKAINAPTFRIEKAEGSENEDTEYFKADYTDKEKYAEDAAAFSRRISSEGSVLLRNENDALPLAEGASVSLFAQGAVSINYSSSGSSASDTQTYDDLKTVLGNVGLKVNPTLWNWYASKGKTRTEKTEGLVKTYTVNEPEWSAVQAAGGASFAEYGDAAIVVLSRDSGEGYDVSTAGSDGLDGSYLSLTRQETELLRGLTALKEEGTFRKIVVLLNAAVPLELDFLRDEAIGVDACLWIGNVGMAGLYGVADILTGDANPSGRLSDTYCFDNFSSPAMASWKYNKNGIFAQEYTNAAEYSLNDSQKYYGVYNEGIYVGYRYYETRYEDYVLGSDNVGTFDYSAQVAYPFGAGQSYTTFAYSGYDVQPSSSGDAYTVTLTVENTGDAAGREVVQVYLQKPYDADAGLEQASVELVGFAKTAELAPAGEQGSSQTVTIEVDAENFRTYDAEENKTYVLAAGDYYLATGRNAHDALNNILAAKGKTPENTEGRMDAEGDASLVKCVLSQGQPDAKRFSNSSETNKAITNRLDFADINRYAERGDNAVVYVSRSDWEGTWPKEAVSLSVSGADMAADLSSHKALPETDDPSPAYNAPKSLSLIMLRGRDYNDDAWSRLLDQMTYEDQALLLSDAAFGTAALSCVDLKATQANDGPTGVKASATGTSFASEGIWASSFDLALIEEVGSFLAEDCRLNGLDTLYAPGINIHRTPFGGRAHEYFSEDPYLTGRAAVAEVQGLQKKGVVAVLKHLAFNEAESARNGICIWLNEQAAREIYLRPFELAMRPSSYGEDAVIGAAGTMSSFNRAGCIWTGASSALQTEIGRGEWGFMGYYITDMASANGALYMTYDDGIFNGTDLFLGSGSKTALREWRDNNAFRQRVREAAHRVLYVIANSNCVMNGVSSGDKIIEIMPWWQVTLISLMAASGAIALLSLGAYVWSSTRKEAEEQN